MFDHLSITARDLDCAQKFYDAVLAPLGVPRGTDVPCARRARNNAAAPANGGSDDGPPGIREIHSPDYYAAFERDPDGNRLEAVKRRPEEQA